MTLARRITPEDATSRETIAQRQARMSKQGNRLSGHDTARNAQEGNAPSRTPQWAVNGKETRAAERYDERAQARKARDLAGTVRVRHVAPWPSDSLPERGLSTYREGAIGRPTTIRGAMTSD